MACYESTVDRATADTYLAGRATWDAASDSDKDDALRRAGIYFDSRYTCQCETPQEKVDEAVSELAYLDLTGKLYPSDDEVNAQYVKKESVKAGSVESETEWSTGSRAIAASDFAYIDDLLKGYCRRQTGATVGLTRD